MSPSYFSMLNHALRCGFWRSVIGQQGGYQNSIEVLLGQGKLLFQYSGLSLSVPFSTLSGVHFLLQHGTISTLRSDPLLVNQRRNLSVLGALSRTFSIPSVSGPPCQVCEYHINRLSSDFTEISLGSPYKWSPMASCHSRALIGNRYIDSVASRISHLSNSTSHARVVCSNRSQGSYRKASMSLTNREPSNSHLSYYGYFVFDIMRRSCNSNPLLGPGSKDLHKSSSACYSAGAAPDVFDSSAREEQLADSAVLSDEKILSDRTLKLFSGSCCIPHPDKEKTGGEDAHFICVDEQAVGVADGVGGWAEVGIDAGKYARELMSNSVTAIQEEPKGSIDPAKVLEKAHLRTKSQGSSTACIIVLREQGIHAINLGDSGFIIVRDGCTVFRSPVQQHGFNFSYQLESGDRADLPGSGQVFTIPIAPGDVIIAGTDGLFDNLYSNEITAVVVHAVRAGLEPQVTAQKIAALARQRAQDKNRQTPFSTAAQDAGFIYYGGKLDDITVVVSYISSSSSSD